MRLLLTNDDGIEAEGLQVLARHLVADGHDVLVVAPDRNYSGSGAALGDLRPDEPLAVRRVGIDGLPDTEAWALAGAPALTVVAALLGAFGELPDLVVSGTNAGCNTGRSVLHSGTVGAALTAANFGLSGLAVSIDDSDSWHWDTAAAIAVEVLPLVARAAGRSVVNLNVPGLPRHEVRGIRWARLAPFGSVRATVTDRRDEEVQFELAPSGHEAEPDTDQGTVDQGWAALTSLVGVAEAWPNGGHPFDDRTPEVEVGIMPGAPLQPVHEVPDGSAPHWLRRPDIGV